MKSVDKARLIDWLKADLKRNGEKADEYEGKYEDLYFIYMGRWDAQSDLLAIIQDGRFDEESDK